MRHLVSLITLAFVPITTFVESFQATTRTFSFFRHHEPLNTTSTCTKLQGGFFDSIGSVVGIAPSKLNPPLDLLKGTNLGRDGVDLVRCYKGSRDGFSAVEFHKKCDGRGSAIVVALTRSGQVFGGFNPLGWQSTDDYGNSNSAFLWFRDRLSGKNTKLPVLSGGNAAIFDYATGGPCFGPADLQIGSPKAAILGGFAGPNMEDTSINAGDLRECSSAVGGAYDFVKGWPCGGKTSLVEVEVYINGNIAPVKKRGGWF